MESATNPDAMGRCSRLEWEAYHADTRRKAVGLLCDHRDCEN